MARSSLRHALGHRVSWLVGGLVLALIASIGQLVDPSPAHAADPAQGQSQDVAKVDARPDVVSARLSARLQGNRVEVTDLRTESSTTWARPDGTLTTDQSAGPVRVRRGDGWVPLDLTLHLVDGGWSPAAAATSVVFSAGGDGPAVKLAEGSKRVWLNWVTSLPAPAISGAKATYALDDNTDLVLTALPEGFSQVLVLKSAPVTAPRIHLPLDLAKLTIRDADPASNDGAGGYEFVDGGGSVLFSTPKPQMWDARTDEAGNPLQRRAIATVQSGTADDPQLDLTPSMSWLTDPATQYPVTIDPTIASATRFGDTMIKDTETGAGLHTADHSFGIGYTGASKMRSILDFSTGAAASPPGRSPAPAPRRFGASARWSRPAPSPPPPSPATAQAGSRRSWPRPRPASPARRLSRVARR